MPSDTIKHTGRLGRGLSICRDARGSTAVEFGLIALPLFILIMGIVECGLFFGAGLVLEGASAQAGRLIRTGQLQASADPEQAFSDALCDHADAMLYCENLQYEVLHIAADSFGAAEGSAPTFDADGNLESQGFDPGNSNDVILIRSTYRYEFLTPFLGAMLTGDPDRNWMNHIATVVIKSEPYEYEEE